MRMLMKVLVPVDPGTKAFNDGSLAATIESTIALIEPEAVYFGLEEGKRTAYFVFDLEDATELPGIAEPIFSALHATIHCTPVMTAADLKTGMTSMASAGSAKKS